MSFSDMMSSGRGPGVIGMLMALVVLVGFGLLFMFAFDEGFQGGGATIESEIASQAKEIENCQGGIEKGQSTLALAPGRIAATKALAGIKRENQSVVERIATLKAGLETGKADIVAMNTAWETYKDQYREFIRGKAKGQTIEKLETRTGVVYKNVNIREVSAVGIQIRHDEGQKRIAFEELSDEMQDYYQFDPAQKDIAIAKETAVRIEHDAAVAVAGDQVEQQMAAQKAQDAVEAKEKLSRDILEKEGQMVNIEADIRELEQERTRAETEADAARQAGRMHINKSSNITGKIRSKQTKLSNLRAEVSQMKGRL
ncbi:MAG: hypothetical protein ABIS50_00720 [Luteolibacter sp.]|uniref:hypothetical protein n=1 Tax=Luteolibacter sp. TaxID=1962973 RepID=UPI003264C6D1